VDGGVTVTSVALVTEEGLGISAKTAAMMASAIDAMMIVPSRLVEDVDVRIYWPPVI
jgi:hypothetical protein